MRRAERSMVGETRFQSYYDRPVIKKPTWKAADIAGYLFLGGLAGASSVVGAGAHFTHRPALARAAKLSSTAAIALSGAALVHDLGRPARFFNMLRVFKPTSPMSVGSWLLAAYAPLSAAASFDALTGSWPTIGATATTGAAVLGSGVATYTAALISNTAVPAWHEGHRYMPFVFAASAASSAAGLGLVAAPLAETAPAQTLGVVAAVAEMGLLQIMISRSGLAGEAFRDSPKAKRLRRAAEALTLAGAAGAAVSGRRHRTATAASGLSLLAGSALTRFAIFEAGVASAEDPKYTIVAQRSAGRIET